MNVANNVGLFKHIDVLNIQNKSYETLVNAFLKE